jgi:hypothetical protein
MLDRMLLVSLVFDDEMKMQVCNVPQPSAIADDTVFGEPFVSHKRANDIDAVKHKS